VNEVIRQGMGGSNRKRGEIEMGKGKKKDVQVDKK
jgi:hypothetical protein